MLTFLFFNQTLWCDHSFESSRRDDFNEGHFIGFGWEIRKLSWKPFCSLFLNCSPSSPSINLFITVQVRNNISQIQLTKVWEASVINGQELRQNIDHKSESSQMFIIIYFCLICVLEFCLIQTSSSIFSLLICQCCLWICLDVCHFSVKV